MEMFGGTSERVKLRLGKLTGAERQEAKIGLLFISPWIIGFLAFTLIPMIASLYFTTLDFQLATPEDAHFVGLDNWKRMLFADPNTWETLVVTFKYAAIALPVGLVLPVMMAILLNSKHLIGQTVFRTLFYAPVMVPAIAGVLIWQSVLNPHTGWINRLIQGLTGYQAVGVEGIRWLDEPGLVYFAFVMMGLWGLGNAMLTSLASLQGVPTELYEASEIDGAGWWRRLFDVTLPMITPVIFYNLVLGVVGLLQYFMVPFVLNGGSGYPEGSTRFYMIYFFKQAFTFANMGYGSTLAWFMFIIALVITLVLFGTQKYWVYYPTEQR